MRFVFLLVLIISVLMISCGESKSADEMYRESLEFYNQGLYTEADQTLKEYLDTYKEDTNNPNALFLRGFIMANHINNLDSAKAIYEFFLTKYADNELSASVKFELDNLGKSPELLLDISDDSTNVTQ